MTLKLSSVIAGRATIRRFAYTDACGASDPGAARIGMRGIFEFLASNEQSAQALRHMLLVTTPGYIILYWWQNVVYGLTSRSKKARIEQRISGATCNGSSGIGSGPDIGPRFCGSERLSCSRLPSLLSSQREQDSPPFNTFGQTRGACAWVRFGSGASKWSRPQHFRFYLHERT
jgi:hypothetical protein